MWHLHLPDGSYLHPCRVERFDISRHLHLWRDEYFVQAKIRRGDPIIIAKHLSLQTAQKLKAQYDREIQESHAQTSAYEDGFEAGFTEGEQSGYDRGVSSGREQGIAFRQQETFSDGEQAGIQRVLSSISFYRDELIKEMSYSTRLSEGRRRSINDMIGILTRIADEFAPPPPAEHSEGHPK